MADAGRMIFLGFGKYARADRIYALEPLRGDDRGGGRRTRVWIDRLDSGGASAAGRGGNPVGGGEVTRSLQPEALHRSRPVRAVC